MNSFQKGMGLVQVFPERPLPKGLKKQAAMSSVAKVTEFNQQAVNLEESSEPQMRPQPQLKPCLLFCETMTRRRH